MEQTRVGTWHLHIDGIEMTEQFSAWCLQAGFEEAHFIGYPPGYQHFEPKRHLTRKLTDRTEFEQAFLATSEAAKRLGMVGYVEGEFISRAIEIPDRPFIEMDTPFMVVRRVLTPEEGFREGEFHLTFRADESDPRRIQQLLDMNLYGTYERKADGHRYLVLSMQGYMKDVHAMSDALERFLNVAGGLVQTRLKIERAVTSELFGITQAQLPPIATRILWL